MSVAQPIPAESVLHDVMVPMRDGVRLATDIYLPQGGSGGPWQALLERTPYDKRAARANEYTAGHPDVFGREELARFFTDAGFAVVFQDCRGRYGSEGRFTKYRGEAEDGFDTIEWIAAQGWCDGQVGTMGLSYSAHTQLAAACLSPPSLAAMICDCGGFANAYQGGIRFGGALELKQVTWALRHALRSPAAAADPVVRAALEVTDIAAWFRRMPWKRGHSPIAAVPDYEDFLFDQWERGRFDAYWQIPALHAAAHHATMRKVPSVHISGWYDPYAVSAVENFTGLAAAGHDAALILGPWTHGNRSRPFAGDVDFGPEATFEAATGRDYVRWRLDVFRRHLQHLDLPPEPRVRYFVMGGGSGRRGRHGRMDHGGHWRQARIWPPEQTRPIRLYLTPDGGLSDTPAATRAARSFVFDPNDPVPTIGGPITSGGPLMEGGAFDQRETATLFGARAPGLPLTSRPDVLVFQTPPLAQPITVAGNLALRLFVSSDRPTTDFTAKLVDVHPPNADYPQGFAMNLADGILRACYRDGHDVAAPLPLGEMVEIVVPMYPVANLFAPGHRIRLEISSSNFPRFDVNPNAAAGDDLSAARVAAVNTVHMGRSHPSAVLLDVL